MWNSQPEESATLAPLFPPFFFSRASGFNTRHSRLMEFIDGAGRLKGGAKALDIWRLETKLEAPKSPLGGDSPFAGTYPCSRNRRRPMPGSPIRRLKNSADS